MRNILLAFVLSTSFLAVGCSPPCPDDPIDLDGDGYAGEVLHFMGVTAKTTDDGLDVGGECVESGRSAGDDCNDDPTLGGFYINPGAREICGDGIDNNCDDQIDENPCYVLGESEEAPAPEDTGSTEEEDSGLMDEFSF